MVSLLLVLSAVMLTWRPHVSRLHQRICRKPCNPLRLRRLCRQQLRSGMPGLLWSSVSPWRYQDVNRRSSIYRESKGNNNMIIITILGNFREFPLKVIDLDGFSLNPIGQNLTWDHGNIFLRVPSHFVYIFSKNFWEPPNITSQKSPKTSDSCNTEMLPIPTSIST